jgi:hypothetical protein
LLSVFSGLPDFGVQFALDVEITGDESLVDLQNRNKRYKNNKKTKENKKQRYHWTSSFDE